MIKISADQILAKCSKAALTGKFSHFIKDVMRMNTLPLSYEGALFIWDHIRVKKNALTLVTSGHDLLRLNLKIPLLSVLETHGHGKLKVSHGEHVIHFFLERKDLVDPYIIYPRKNLKELIADILDDLINRPQPLHTHDTENFKWEGNQIRPARNI